MGNTFKIYVSTDNAAFGETDMEDARYGRASAECCAEIARILRECAAKIEGGALGFASETVRDVNGNDVGRYALKTAAQWGSR